MPELTAEERAKEWFVGYEVLEGKERAVCLATQAIRDAEATQHEQMCKVINRYMLPENSFAMNQLLKDLVEALRRA